MNCTTLEDFEKAAEEEFTKFKVHHDKYIFNMNILNEKIKLHYDEYVNKITKILPEWKIVYARDLKADRSFVDEATVLNIHNHFAQNHEFSDLQCSRRTVGYRIDFILTCAKCTELFAQNPVKIYNFPYTAKPFYSSEVLAKYNCEFKKDGIKKELKEAVLWPEYNKEVISKHQKLLKNCFKENHPTPSIHLSPVTFYTKRDY